MILGLARLISFQDILIEHIMYHMHLPSLKHDLSLHNHLLLMDICNLSIIKSARPM